MANHKPKIAVAGAGLAGLTCALALAQKGGHVVLIAPKALGQDKRTTALLSGSVDFLKKLAIWDDVATKAAPMARMRIIDDTGRLFRAPLLDFIASEIGLNTFGQNIENSVLATALKKRIAQLENCEMVEASIQNVVQEADGITLFLEDNSKLKIDILIGAEGRNSPTREAIGAKADFVDYPQSAIVMNVLHSVSHNQASNEFHTPTGPMTTVPLGEVSGQYRSSIVWVEAPEKAQEIMELSLGALNVLVESKTHSMLGKISIESKPKTFALSRMVSDVFAHERMFLIGEAAHVMPPIGAQGFNLGLRDVEYLYDHWESLIAKPEQIARTYDKDRKRDAHNRAFAVDAINRSLLSDFLPSQLPRTLGLHAMDTLTPLRRFIMREGLRPGDGVKSISNPLDIVSSLLKRTGS